MIEAVAQLIQVSHAIGGKLELIQGGGGNTSIKADGVMYIKASGTPLKAMSETKGWVALDHDASDQKPSMEWPMHLLLPTVVAHAHAVYPNVFNCMVGGVQQLAKILDQFDPIIIPYVTPGQELANSIAQRINGITPKLLLLENHGVIVCGDDVPAVLKLIAQTNQLVLSELQQRLPDFKPFTLNPLPPTLNPTPSLFPDAAVFTGTITITDGVREILAANNYLHDTIVRLGEVAQPLPLDEGEKLRHMEQEQYRLSLNHTNVLGVR